MKESKRGAIALARHELKKESKENLYYYLFLVFLVFSFILFLVVLTLHLMQITGLVPYIGANGGYITETNLYYKRPVFNWGGLYGLVFRVPGYTQQISIGVKSDIQERGIYFDCVKLDAPGGPEVYASTNPGIVLTYTNVVPGKPETVDQFTGCNNSATCATNTFTKNMTIYLGDKEIDGIPSTFTYKYTGENEIFDIGVLNVSGNLVFVSHINNTIQKGYNPNTIVNYQMLLPVPENTTQTYYFYTDPFDVCPAGGIGSTINVTIQGFTFDQNGTILPGVSVSAAGFSEISNSNGFYNLSVLLLEGDYSLIGQKSGYKPGVRNFTINFSTNFIERNISLDIDQQGGKSSLTPLVYGYIKDTGGNPLFNVTVYLGNESTSSNDNGFYSFNPSVTVGLNTLVAIIENYDNFYTRINFDVTTESYNQNITMEPANFNEYPTGPFTNPPSPGISFKTKTQTAKSEAEKAGQDFWVSAKEINKQVRENTFIEDSIDVYNFKPINMQVQFAVSSSLDGLVSLDKSTLSVAQNTFESVVLTISGTKPVGIYKGTITLSGDINQEIPVTIEVVPRKLNIEALLMQLELMDKSVSVGGTLKYRLGLQNLLTEQSYKVDLKFMVMDSNNTNVLMQDEDNVEIDKSLTLLKEFNFPGNFSEGDYVLRVDADYLGYYSNVVTPFKVVKPIYLYSFFGVPLWIVFMVLFFLSFVMFNLFLYRRHLNKLKRYHLTLYTDLLPKQGERSIKLGQLAEKKINAYYNLDDLTTHAIVAGATGGGKSISAQVFVEEALLKGIAVIVFDPTAQWSGMLRKNEDKKMMSFYPKFGLKPSDARAFPGNVRQVTNEKLSVDIKKYINPGQIQVFTMNKMTPQQIDIFVAGVINNIFKSDPKEFPGLRVMLVFDEVHRLLPKFGGSGKGFLQIERACREFRKWGFGVMLVSQVLSDFVGEIKANINTEVQMRVAEENDLARIKERYGEESLRSLVRADVGTAMIQNAEYNKGLPYFVAIRPILHNTRRLTDEVLEKYNNYNDLIDDLEFQVEQLEAEKVDTFDLKMELKLVKDKLMTGNFTVVDIYLEGLKPRIEKAWVNLGKKPKAREIALIDTNEIDSTFQKAQRDRAEAQKRQEALDKGNVVAKEEVKEDIGKKIVAPITFDNGMMVSSLNELKEVLPTLDKNVFKIHVNDNKNEIADWVEKNVDAKLGKQLKENKAKDEMIKVLTEFGKVKKEEKKDEKKEGEKEEKNVVQEKKNEINTAEKKEEVKQNEVEKVEEKKVEVVKETLNMEKNISKSEVKKTSKKDEKNDKIASSSGVKKVHKKEDLKLKEKKAEEKKDKAN